MLDLNPRSFLKSLLRGAMPLVIATGALASTALADDAAGKKVIFLGADDICEYCAAYNDALRLYAKDADLDLEVVTNKFDAAQQATQITQAIAKKPDLILLWTIDGTALFPSMRKIGQAGIPLLLTDVQPDAAHDDLWISYSGANYEGEGREAADLMLETFKAKGLGEEGDVIMITGIVGQAQTMSRYKGFSERLAEIAPGINIVAQQPGNWDTGTAMDAASGLLTKYGSTIKGIYSDEDVMMKGVVAAADRAGVDVTKLAMVSVGCEPAGVELLKQGKLDATLGQAPADEARYAIDSIVNYFNGAKLEKSVYTPMPIARKANGGAECKPWDQF
ncbi:substrate-binding domain-containing protein [Martelella alba]|uniref:Substrate-binding domain-containing protein n=1 Tax=Martelella alba TaxID=2590451 RepID=A0A506U1F2_9HYPH|nr:sugar ABC transporter substrate-binding protein [Martelella alba]TPW26765.1 substrate-binding domain-containing protein [Martelella alba]